MEKRKTRTRGSNWNHAQTMALAELKREASLNKEYGPLVWERIAQTLSSRFRGQIRTGAQCRRRWDTLVKVYNHIEDYCVVTGQGHRELDEGELASMELATAYHQDWYGIVEQVCSQRRSKEGCDGDLRLAKRSKGSHSVELPEHPPNRDTVHSVSTSKSVKYYKQSTLESTTTYAQVSFRPSLEADKLSPEEEVPRLKNGNDGLVLEATQLRQHGQVSLEVSQEPQTLESVNLLPHTIPAENGAQLREPLQDDLWAWLDAMPFETSAEIEQPEIDSELTEPFYWDWESVSLRAQPQEPLRDHGGYRCWDNAYMPSVGETIYYKYRCQSGQTWHSTRGRPPSLRQPTLYSERNKPPSLQKPAWYSERNKPLSLPKPPPAFSGIGKRSGHGGGGSGPGDGMRMYAGGRQFGLQESVCHSKSTSGDSTMISRRRRRWSLQVIVLRVRQFCRACGRKERIEDMEMESKQAAWLRARLEESARKKAQMSRKKNVPAMLNATSATWGDKPLQKDSKRIPVQITLDKKGKETRFHKAERQQLGSKSSSICGPIGRLCAKLSRKLFPAFHG